MRWGKFWRFANGARLAVYLIALWKLVRHRDTPRLAKLCAAAVLAYAVSPIDLVPDFIPVLGLLDELVLIPLGVALVVKLTPDRVWQARLREAETQAEALPKLKWGIAIVLMVWLLVLALVAGSIVYALWPAA